MSLAANPQFWLNVSLTINVLLSVIYWYNQTRLNRRFVDMFRDVHGALVASGDVHRNTAIIIQGLMVTNAIRYQTLDKPTEQAQS